MEAPLTENIWQVHQDQPVVILGAGSDWGQPYSCEEWAYTFGLSYPLLDDSDGMYIIYLELVTYHIMLL